MQRELRGRSAHKHEAIVGAAAAAFLTKGYLGTSMDDVAAQAAVSKQTVYKHFADKESLFAEIILSTAKQIDAVVRLVDDVPANPDNLRAVLVDLAGSFLTALTRPPVLRLRRLVIANADRFPELSRTWYMQGFERVLESLGATLRRLTDEGLLRVDDPLLAANHFTGLLLWIPLNKAMFCLDDGPTDAEVSEYSVAAVDAFLAAYGAPVAAAYAAATTTADTVKSDTVKADTSRTSGGTTGPAKARRTRVERS